MKDFFIWFVYNMLFLVGYTLMLPKFLLRMWRRGGYRADFMQRFGRYDSDLLLRMGARRRIWVHAVSVGEVFVALQFMDEMRRKLPEYGFVLSTTTSTGYAQAKARLADDDVLIYYPTDLPHIVRRVVRQLNPVALVLMECELWPNLLRRLYRNNVPVFVVNGRISESSFRGYKKVRFFFRRAVAWVNLLMVQSRVDEQRLLALGTAPKQLVVTGSTKYDTAVPDKQSEAIANSILRDAGMNPDAKILVAGSTWPGEEEVLLDIFKILCRQNADLQLILVPRHMERRAEVESILRSKSVEYIKRTDMQKAGFAAGGAHPNVLLADTTGELKHYYSVATLVFVGKSLGDNFGGQNPIEPAMFGKPIVVGPHMENFPGVMQDFEEAEALVQVADEDELQHKLKELLSDAESCRLYGERASDLVKSKRGATARSVDLIQDVLKSRGD